MGSYNYEALHKNTPIVKRPWIPDQLAAKQGYINGNVQAVYEPYIKAYKNNPLLLALQAQAQAPIMLGGSNGLRHYNFTKYNLPNRLIPPIHPLEVADRDCYANVYANRLSVRRPMFQQTQEPRREFRKRRVREQRVKEPVMKKTESEEPVKELSTSQSPAQMPELMPNAAAEPPLPGMIFGCTSDTYIECMQMKLFALPAANKSEVMRVVPGTKLFLYNYEVKELSGIFEATSNGDMNLEPDAFQGFFPAQVRIKYVQKCPNLPLKAFKEAMSANFHKNKNKFKYSLNDDQVQKLISLFQLELKHWKKYRPQQQRNTIPSRFQPYLRPLQY